MDPKFEKSGWKQNMLNFHPTIVERLQVATKTGP